MSYQPAGIYARQRYDDCQTMQLLNESTGPYLYSIFQPKFEHKDRCIYKKYPQPFAARFVDNESDLSGRNKPNSKCTGGKYPFFKCDTCVGTFEGNKNAVVLDPDVCPIVFNNRYQGGSGIPNIEKVECSGRRV
uniref:Uncharacterized protein n=1 Tax=viral metagenome TaxID=1070528 RepID=A0A6C0E076_9ZZZZ